MNAHFQNDEQETDKPNAPCLGPVTARRLAIALRKVESAVRRLIVLHMNTQDLKLRTDTKRQVAMPDFSCFAGEGAERAPSFNLIDPRKRLMFHFYECEEEAQTLRESAVPRISVWLEDNRLATLPDGCKPDDEAENQQRSERLLKRLLAVDRALKTIPQQARRLARLMEKREKAPPGPGRVPAIRPGVPPGFCERDEDEANRILRECHGLVRDWERGSIP